MFRHQGPWGSAHDASTGSVLVGSKQGQETTLHQPPARGLYSSCRPDLGGGQLPPQKYPQDIEKEKH